MARIPRPSRLGAVKTGALVLAVVGVAPLAGAAPAAQAAVTAVANTAARGSLPVGSAAYAVPSGAVFVSPSGNDANSGSASAPKRTVNAAVAASASGRTIVLRKGTYHETVVIPRGKALTIQAYPREAVWFDGTRSVTGFSKSGSTWVAPWNVKFDSSPTDSWGQPDGTTPGWQFVNSAYPMAAHPDQVWIGGTELRQVSSQSAVRSGTFYVNYSTGRMYIGNNPSGRSVVASDLPQAFQLLGSGTRLLGFGIRRFADSVPHQGVITAYSDTTTIENVDVRDSATAGIGIFGKNSRLNRVSVIGSGQLGIGAHHADNFVVSNSTMRNSNDQYFNPTPSAGGIKVTTSRGVTLANSDVRDTYGNGFWVDESTYDVTVVNNTIHGNTGRGVFIELSAKVVVADNLIKWNGGEQFIARNSNGIQLWNNTVYGFSKPIEFAMDSRTPANSRYATDPRRPFPDPTMTWVMGDTTIGNNIVQGKQYLLDIEDYTGKRSATALGFKANGNVYSQPKAGTPNWVVVWARANDDPAVFTTVGGFRSATGFEKTGVSQVGASAVTPAYDVVGSLAAKTAAIAQPLPAEVAGKLGRANGVKHLGYWR